MQLLIDTSNGQHILTSLYGLIVEKNIVDYGFGMEGDKVITPDDQKARLFNLNTTMLPLDGNSQKWSGRPTVMFYDGF